MSESAIPRLAISIGGGAPMKANDNWPRVPLTNRTLRVCRLTRIVAGSSGPQAAVLVKSAWMDAVFAGPNFGIRLMLIASIVKKAATTPWLG